MDDLTDIMMFKAFVIAAIIFIVKKAVDYLLTITKRDKKAAMDNFKIYCRKQGKNGTFVQIN